MCPLGTHSNEGSIATDFSVACKPKRNCTIDDMPKTYSDSCVKSKDGNSLVKAFDYNVQGFEEQYCVIDATMDYTKT